VTGRGDAWPALPVEAWEATRDTVHMWTQIVGKVRLALAPMLNHWWQVPLYVNGTGLTTSLMPYGGGGVEIGFDFQRHRLTVVTVAGQRRELVLEPRSVADFHDELFARLGEVGVEVEILGRPVEVEVAIPFAEDEEHAAYDAEFAHRFWRSLVSAERVLSRFRSGYVGKASPVQFYWGSFDLAAARFSGRPAPRHPGGFPNVADRVMEEAYSHELSNAGYWPGGADEGLFFAYAYPEPDGYREADVAPAAATFDTELGEFVLPYRDVRTTDDPDAVLLEFLRSTYEAAADLGGWDRQALERRTGVGAQR
jgi:hypothetical protein